LFVLRHPDEGIGLAPVCHLGRSDIQASPPQKKTTERHDRTPGDRHIVALSWIGEKNVCV